MKLSFTKLHTTTHATPGTVLALSRDVNTDLGVAAALNGGLVVLYCPSTNSDPVYIGPDNSADFYDISPGQYYALPGTNLPQMSVDLGTWFCKSTGISQAVRIVYVKNI